MILKILKILFIFLLTAACASCAVGDDDDEYIDSPVPSDSKLSDAFVISEPWWHFGNGLYADSIQVSDTLLAFPSQEQMAADAAQYIFGFQQLAADIESTLKDIVKDDENKWMDFYSPYYAAFVSSSDSRPKQWQLDNDIMFEGTIWPYHLVVLDLPDGSVEGKSNNAIEIYYNAGFSSGIMLFSPSHFNSVSYPEKIMGHGTVCRMDFSMNASRIENTLYVSGGSESMAPMSCKNMFLTLSKSSGGISFASVVDMPYLWFSKKEDCGYSAIMIGGIDCSNGNLAMMSGLCQNIEPSNMLASLASQYSTESVMPEYNARWNESIALDSAGAILSYQTPIFMTNGQYVGAGREVVDRSAFSKALSKAEEAKNIQFQVSPYKISIMQIEW